MEDQVLTFLGAGHETTASGVTWTLHLLALNQHAQAKLRAECQGEQLGRARASQGLRKVERGGIGGWKDGWDR